MLRVFGGVLSDAIGRLFLKARAGGLDEDGHGQLFHLLALEAELSSERLVGSAWQNHLLDRLLTDENAFSAKAQRAGAAGMGPGLLDAASDDLAQLRGLFDWPLEVDGFRPLGDAEPEGFKLVLARTADWRGLLEPLAGYFHEHGGGVLARFRAFRWLADAAGGRLEPIPNPDPITLEELYCYELERQLLVANTEQFVAGHPANNVLLYGDRGTGKSSSVKALLQRHPGLKMIELSPDHLAELPLLLDRIAGTPHRFILFVDDLSFEEFEVQYKHLKAVLEGGLQVRPSNVLIYATSNRRHLVKERFSDLTKPIINDEIHQQDTVQEKLSLSDRFGIT
ncbi:MAG: ATP-binding protein, partial [Chloroflexota bacterium]|nr:ATP-binding protein [Chloroflexota bacterium]